MRGPVDGYWRLNKRPSHNIAIGDIKMILGRTLGKGGLSDVMHSRHLAEVLTTNMEDGELFNTIRQDVWERLRELFPDKVRLDMLVGEIIGPTEPPMAFIHRILGTWRAEFGKNPEEEVLQQAMFRKGVIQGLAETAQGGLGDVVSLYSMPFAQFCEHIIHVVTKERSKEEKRLQDDREDVRKLNKIQLKTRIQAVLVAPSPVPYKKKQWEGKPEMPQEGVVSQNRPYNQDGPPPQRYGYRGYQRQDKTCWGCGQAGHFKQDCPGQIRQPEPQGNDQRRPAIKKY